MMKLNPMYYTDQHYAFADSVKKFVEKEIMPHVNEWDEAGTFPRELYKKAAEVGLMGAGFDEKYGGVPETDAFYTLLGCIELAKCASGGLVASLLSHMIGTPPIHAFAQDEVKDEVLPQILS